MDVEDCDGPLRPVRKYLKNSEKKATALRESCAFELSTPVDKVENSVPAIMGCLNQR
jgi:hypothetical protein